MKLTITKKIGIFLMIPTCGALLTLGIFYWFLSQTAMSASIINIAGRQRMISQQLLHHAQMAYTGQKVDQEGFDELVFVFDQSLQLMEHGGEAMGEYFPPAPPEVLDKIAEVKRLWSRHKAALLLITDGSTADQQAQEAYEYVQSNTQLLTKASDRVVTAYESRDHALWRQIFYTLAVTVALDLTLLIAGVWIVRRYVTERKRGEEILRKSEERLQSILDNSPTVIYLKDTEGRFLLINRRFEDIFHISIEDIKGKTDHDLFPKVMADAFWANDLRVLETGMPLEIEEVVPQDDGMHTYISIKFCVRNPNGVPYAVGGISADITKRKRTEGRLLEAKEEMEKAYQDIKITQSQLLHSEKMASIGQLAAGVAHEINNPLAYICSNLGTLQKYVKKLVDLFQGYEALDSSILEDNRPEVRDLAKAIMENKNRINFPFIKKDLINVVDESLEGVKKLSGIVQNLKSFSRVDEAEYKHADINECIEDTLKIVWNEIKYKATVNKEYGDIPYTKCYPQQLNQVFMNLLVNSAHAIEEKGEIRIKTWQEDGSILVSISDTGCGIPKDKINRIFEPFFTTKEVGKGTGLGLSISYDIIKKHNGEILVESDPGKGTTFIIKIPALKE